MNAVGWIEGGFVASCEKLILDAEIPFKMRLAFRTYLTVEVASSGPAAI